MRFKLTYNLYSDWSSVNVKGEFVCYTEAPSFKTINVTEEPLPVTEHTLYKSLEDQLGQPIPHFPDLYWKLHKVEDVTIREDYE